LFDVVIRGGTLITPGGLVNADLAVTGEQIAAVGLRLDGRQVIPADGMLVLPGGVDPHVHLQMPAGAAGRSSDGWESGTIAAACGGTTTVIDFIEPSPEAGQGGGLVAALAARRAEAEGCAVVDFGLHMTLMDAGPATLAEIPQVVEAGCPSFKTYLTYPGFRLDDDGFLAALTAVAGAGAMALVHAENDAAIRYLQARLLAGDFTEPKYHPLSRPPGTEAEAVGRALVLAEIATCPLYVVHVSTERGAAAVARARARGQAAFGETCPQYLLLTAAEYDRPDFEGARFVCSPPLRAAQDNAGLWRHLAAGDLQTVGTDHCPFFFKGQKDLGSPAGQWPPFTSIPGGMPGVEARLSLLYTAGVLAGRLSLEQWIQACCTMPARIFGLYPRKGALIPGSDADLVIFNPRKEIILSRTTLHENCDYTPYEGMRLGGYPVLTMSRGRVLVQDGRFCGPRGHGRFLARSEPSVL